MSAERVPLDSLLQELQQAIDGVECRYCGQRVKRSKCRNCGAPKADSETRENL